VCTLAFAWREFEDAPLVVAANRDEALGRPSDPPAVRPEHPGILMPRDAEAGGTWMGVTDDGLFVGVTNRRADVEGDRSRGLLVRDALGTDSASDAADLVEAELGERDYSGFNLVLADREDCLLYVWDGSLSRRELSPGVHVVVNAGADDETEKSREVREALSGHDSVDAWLDAARTALRDHEAAVCVHRDGYGTRSSSLVTLSADGSVAYEFADGPPCEAAYEPVEDQL
jgi:uncharacterized protein with NRDE domain